jgi:hypothetical protein
MGFQRDAGLNYGGKRVRGKKGQGEKKKLTVSFSPFSAFHPIVNHPRPSPEIAFATPGRGRYSISQEGGGAAAGVSRWDALPLGQRQ